jgi:hypothetical protein
MTLHDAYIRRPVIDLFPVQASGMILDVGFGYGEWGLLMRQMIGGDARIVGVDTYKPYCEAQRGLGIYAEIHGGDALAYLRGLGERPSFLLMADVIEHQPREWGFSVLREIERLNPLRAVVTTPCGFNKVPRGRDGNPDNQHLSGWAPEDFKGWWIRLVPLVTVPFWLRPVQSGVNVLRGGKAVAEIVAWRDAA